MGSGMARRMNRLDQFLHRYLVWVIIGITIGYFGAHIVIYILKG